MRVKKEKTPRPMATAARQERGNAEKTALHVPIRHGAPSAPARHLMTIPGADTELWCPNHGPKVGNPPRSHSSQGVGKTTRRVSETTPGHTRNQCGAAETRKQGENQNDKRRNTKHPAAQRPRNRIRGPKTQQGTSPERIPKTHGGKNHTPDKPPEEEGRAAKKVGTKTTQRPRGKTTTEKTTPRREGGSVRVTCDYLSFLSWKDRQEKKKKKDRQTDRQTDRQKKREQRRRQRRDLRRRERDPKKPRPDKERIFFRGFSGEDPQKWAKTIGRTVPKQHTPQKASPSKSTLPKIVGQNPLRKEAPCKKALRARKSS